MSEKPNPDSRLVEANLADLSLNGAEGAARQPRKSTEEALRKRIARLGIEKHSPSTSDRNIFAAAYANRR